MMSMVLSKSELVEKKEEENRGLSRRVEDTNRQLIEANAKWKQVNFIRILTQHLQQIFHFFLN